jgi:hypothetical protein
MGCKCSLELSGEGHDHRGRGHCWVGPNAPHFLSYLHRGDGRTGAPATPHPPACAPARAWARANTTLAPLVSMGPKRERKTNPQKGHHWRKLILSIDIDPVSMVCAAPLPETRRHVNPYKRRTKIHSAKPTSIEKLDPMARFLLTPIRIGDKLLPSKRNHAFDP